MTRREVFPAEDDVAVRPAPVVRRFFVAGVLCTIVAEEAPASRRPPDGLRPVKVDAAP